MASEEEKIMLKELLCRIAGAMSQAKQKEYIVNCFLYNNVYEYIGTHSDTPLGTETRKEKFIAITPKDYNTDGMFCGYLNYPWENDAFYSTGEFILVSRNIADFQEKLSTLIGKDDLKEYLDGLYGLPQNVQSAILKQYKVNKGKGSK